MVGLELVELHLEVGRREDVCEDHGVQVHGLFVAPQRQHVALLARGRWLGAPALQRLLHGRDGAGRVLGRLLPLAVRHRGAVVGHGGSALGAGGPRTRSGAGGRCLSPDKMAAGEVTAAPSGAASPTRGESGERAGELRTLGAAPPADTPALSRRSSRLPDPRAAARRGEGGTSPFGRARGLCPEGRLLAL